MTTLLRPALLAVAVGLLTAPGTAGGDCRTGDLTSATDTRIIKMKRGMTIRFFMIS